MSNLTRIIMALAFISAGMTAQAGQDVSESRSVDADAYISVSNAFGEIIISGWDRNEVLLVSAKAKPTFHKGSACYQCSAWNAAAAKRKRLRYGNKCNLMRCKRCANSG